jgi:hypothetical protein
MITSFKNHLNQGEALYLLLLNFCCIRCGPDEERILDVVPGEDGARNSG